MAGTVLVTVTYDDESVEIWADGDGDKVVKKIRRALGQ